MLSQKFCLLHLRIVSSIEKRFGENAMGGAQLTTAEVAPSESFCRRLLGEVDSDETEDKAEQVTGQVGNVCAQSHTLSIYGSCSSRKTLLIVRLVGIIM